MNKFLSQSPLVLTLVLTLIFGSHSARGQYPRGDVPPDHMESAAWQAAAKKDELASYERFIARFPDSRFHQAAIAAIEFVFLCGGLPSGGFYLLRRHIASRVLTVG